MLLNIHRPKEVSSVITVLNYDFILQLQISSCTQSLQSCAWQRAAGEFPIPRSGRLQIDILDCHTSSQHSEADLGRDVQRAQVRAATCLGYTLVTPLGIKTCLWSAEPYVLVVVWKEVESLSHFVSHLCIFLVSAIF